MNSHRLCAVETYVLKNRKMHSCPKGLYGSNNLEFEMTSAMGITMSLPQILIPGPRSDALCSVPELDKNLAPLSMLDVNIHLYSSSCRYKLMEICI